MSTAIWYADVLDGETTLDELRDRGARNRALVEARQNGNRPTSPDVVYVSTREAIQQWIDEENRSEADDTSTGWPTIDVLLGKPMRHSEVVVIAARTGVGKTWALQAIIEYALAHRLDLDALLIQLEMPAFHMAERIAAHALQIPPGSARRKAKEHLTVDDVVNAAPHIDRLGMVEQSLHANQIPAAIEAMERATGRRPGIVAVDYLGLLRGSGRTRYEVASEVSRDLKAIAKQERVLLLVAAQLSRDGGDGSKQPTLDMLRDSGVAEEAADRVIGLWRPTPIEDEDHPQIAAGVELGVVVLKNRFGPTGGEAKLAYDASLTLIESEDDGIPW